MSDDVESLPVDVVYVETRQDSTSPTVIVVGEFDRSGTEQFWAKRSRVGRHRSSSKPAGSRSLIRLGWRPWCGPREAATEAGVTFRVSEPSPPLRRITQICGLDGLLLHE